MRQIIKNNIDWVIYREGQGSTAELFDIVVNSQRCKGIGTSLVNDVIAELTVRGVKRLYAFTRYENHKARSFYEKLGFSETIVRNFYPDGDAVLVVKEI